MLRNEIERLSYRVKPEEMEKREEFIRQYALPVQVKMGKEKKSEKK